MKILFIVYCNGSHLPIFPQNIAYLVSACKAAGHQADVYLQDIHHFPDSHITQFLDESEYDVVGLGFVAGYYQYRKAIDIAQAVNESKRRGDFIFVLGGHGPSAAPEYFREILKADLVVIGEGERFFGEPEFTVLPDEKKNAELLTVSNCVSSDLNFGVIDDVDRIHWPAYEDFPIEIYRLSQFPTSKETDFCMPILSGRGCLWKCTFCYRMVPGFRPRDPWAVIDEMSYLQKEWQINHFNFSDELFMSSKERIHLFCEALIKARMDPIPWAETKLKPFKWDCSGRLNFAKPKELELMKRAGCEYVNYGIESLNDNVLMKMKKGLSVQTITEGIKATLEAGLTPGLNFMWGNIGDNEETLDEMVSFLLAHDRCMELRTIRPVTPYPGSPLFDYAVENGYLEGVEDFYENKHINSDLLTCNFTDIPDERFHHLLFTANAMLINNYTGEVRAQNLARARKLYDMKDKTFRGFRPI
ncbi:MAG: B12-binding domain-containing radical SAM protein [Desulfobacteraceae bacterium]|nr:MAG: B12-binding domain-containing radical SAM protein [Desulfobacteraceae bacterium]